MFELKRLKVKGFRGFVGEHVFEFSEPVAILYGENHRGKSSTLNAIEWCLFGDNCMGSKTGIRERMDWEVANRHAVDGDVRVEAEFKGPDGSYVVTRQANASGKRGSGSLTATLPDGTALQGEEASRRLTALFRSSFRDFMTTVYQHQETIRGILTDVASDRNDAIDRLLGLSYYRELRLGIRASDIEKIYRGITSRSEGLRDRAEQSIRTLDNLVKEQRADAAAQELVEEDLEEEGALRRAKQIGDAVRDLAEAMGITSFDIDTPQQYQEMEEFPNYITDKVDDLWNRAPDSEKHKDIVKEQLELIGIREAYSAATDEEVRAHNNREGFVQQNGDAEALARRVQEAAVQVANLETSMGETNRRAKLVREAIGYLKEAGSGEAGEQCPLCLTKIPNLLGHLQTEWEDNMKHEVAELEAQLNARAAERGRLSALRTQFEALDKETSRTRSQIVACLERVGAALGRELGREDDPGALISARLRQVETELQRVSQSIEQKKPKRRAIFDRLKELRAIKEVINSERKKAIVERVFDSPEYQELSQILDEIAQFVDDVQAIRGHLAAASREEAESKIHAAGSALDENFRRLTGHPAIGRLVMNVAEDTRSGNNSYTFKGKDGTDPQPILSQGDLNCLALSLFLGLAKATSAEQPFSFVMLDDPSQSLGSSAKRQIVAVLGEVAEWRQLIIATPDNELKEMLVSNLTKSKTVFRFDNWTINEGPTITKGL